MAHSHLKSKWSTKNPMEMTSIVVFEVSAFISVQELKQRIDEGGKSTAAAKDDHHSQ
jgi:hypothetical protein